MKKYSPAAFVSTAVPQVKSLAEERGYSSVCLAGAPAAGLGSPMSDIDIYVFGSGRRDGASQVRLASGVRGDIEFLSLDSIHRDLDDLAAFEVTQENLSLLELATTKVLDRLARIECAVPVVDHTGDMAALIGRARSHADVLGRFQVARHAISAMNASEDAEGFSRMSDWEPAHHQYRRALYDGINALLASEGERYMGDKWLWAKWRRSGLAGTCGHVDAWVEAQYTGSTRQATPSVYADSLARLAQDVLLRSITRRPDLPLSPAEAEPLTLVRPRDLWPIPVKGGALVFRADRSACLVSDAGCQLLVIADGRHATEAAEEGAALFRAQSIECTPQDVYAYLDQLVVQGLLETASLGDAK